MAASLDELERLAALHRSGVLTDDEFAAQKARVLGSATTPAAAVFTRTSETAAVAPPEPSKVWQRRFAFFDEHGSPLSATGYAALRKLPFWTAMSIRSNWWAFFWTLLLPVPWRLEARSVACCGLDLIASSCFGKPSKVTGSRPPLITQSRPSASPKCLSDPSGCSPQTKGW